MAVKETVVPALKRDLQTEPQKIPSGLLVTEPDPLDIVTFRLYWGTFRDEPDTVTACITEAAARY